MSRFSLYVLLTCLAFGAVCGSRPIIATPLYAPSATALPSDDRERETAKYNRKLNKLETKRTRDMQKLEANYLKLLQRKKTMDLRKLQQRLDEFQRKQQRLDKKYRLELQKLEREMGEKGL